MSEQLVQWVAPAPVWNDAARLGGTATVAFRKPMILRFASDSFMDELLTILEVNPAALGARRAVWESWRDPAPNPPLPSRPTPVLGGRFARQRPTPAATVLATPAVHPDRPPKLYQPSHGRYYLVATCLVCRLPGLPDRVVDAGADERASFVIRRLTAREGGEDESALVTEQGVTGWRRVTTSDGSAATVLSGEETHPLSPVSYTEPGGLSRRLWTGLVPVSKRETYTGAPNLPETGVTAAATSTEPQPHPALLLFQRLVSGPWLSLIDTATTANRTVFPSAPDTPLPDNERRRFLRETRENIQTGSWYVLLDFALFLKEQLPAVWTAVESASSAGLSPEAKALYAKLEAVKLDSGLAAELTAPVFPTGSSAYGQGDLWESLREALAGIVTSGDDLEEIATAYDRTTKTTQPASGPQWPPSLFPLTDPLYTVVNTATDEVAAIEALVAAALPDEPAGPTPAIPIGARAPADPVGRDHFVIRCVYERPNCSPILPPLVSTASDPFLLASFFDPDAPARPIRIPLPVDISPAGLRKFDKNAVFMVSDALCGQINRLKQLSLGDLVRSVLPWPLHKDLSVGAAQPCRDGSGLCLGLAISISIPIITICALILLLVMVILLDVIFRWLPYFIFVYPVRLFCGKGSS